MLILALDPGPTETGWVVLTDDRAVRACGTSQNGVLLSNLENFWNDGAHLAIEMVASYGMAVGREVFETVWWIGRFTQAWPKPDEVRRVYRMDVKMHVCKDSRAKDANIRAGLLDMFPASGGGKTPQIGTVKQPGPLFGVSGHMWSALGVAVTAQHQMVAAC
jgi:hypothetical protein